MLCEDPQPSRYWNTRNARSSRFTHGQTDWWLTPYEVFAEGRTQQGRGVRQRKGYCKLSIEKCKVETQNTTTHFAFCTFQ